MTAPRQMIVRAVEAFKADSSPALFWEILAMCEGDQAAKDYFRQETSPAMTFTWPQKRGRKAGSTDAAFVGLALATKEVLDMVAASDGKLRKADAVRDVANRKGIQERQLSRATYGDNAAVCRLLPEYFSPPNSP